jgi:acetyltransferase-like isoleucine patch superfamily enzyme
VNGRDAVLERVRKGYWFGLRWLWRLRRARLILRVKVTARVRYAHVELDIADDVMLSRDVTVEIEPGTSNHLAIGAHARLRPGVLLWLRGGTIRIGTGCGVRADVRMDSSGVLDVGDDVILSYGLAVHCAEAVTIGKDTIVGEYSTITDSVHRRTASMPILHHVRTGPTTIGENVWIGASAVVAHGVTVGDRAFVASHAVVTRDVPAQWLAAGAPAKPVRELAIDEDEP